MFKKYKIHNAVLFLLVFVFFSTTGCEQLSQIGEYFKKKKEELTKSSQQQKTKTKNTASAMKPMAPNVLARVGSWTITIEEFNERLKALKEVVPEYDITDPEAKALILEELLRQQLLVADAEKTGLEKEKEIKAAVDEFRRTLIVREMARKLTEDIKVTTAEALEFYEQQKDVLVEPEQWRVRELGVNTQEEAKEILIQLLNGADFAEMTKQKSVLESASKGGDLGFLDEPKFPAMGSALLPLAEGDVSSVFKGPEDKYYIVKLEEKRGGETIDFDDIKKEIIENRTLYKQQQAILDHLDKLRQTINVEVNEDLLKK